MALYYLFVKLEWVLPYSVGAFLLQTTSKLHLGNICPFDKTIENFIWDISEIPVSYFKRMHILQEGGDISPCFWHFKLNSGNKDLWKVLSCTFKMSAVIRLIP